MEVDSSLAEEAPSRVLKNISNENKTKLQSNKEVKAAFISTMMSPSEETRPADCDSSVVSDASSGIDNISCNIPEKENSNMSGDGLTNENSLITAEMMEEEANLHKQTMKEEEEIKKQGHMDMEEETAETRYEKLKFLLSKSQMYSSYLLNRMQKQKAEDKIRQQRLEKKAAKEAQKKAKQEEEKLKEMSETEEVIKAADKDSGEETKRGSRTRNANTQDSQGSQTRGRKRKAGDSPRAGNAMKIVDFFSPKNKRRKTGGQENDEAAADVATEDIKPDKPIGEQVTLVKGIRMFKTEAIPKEQPDLFVGGILRKYQIDGLNWLRGLYENGVNGILADEMGLGKTIQCISLVSHLVDRGINGPFLVCAPLSTVPNWVSEFKKFAPKVPVMLYHGSKDERHILRRKMRRLHPVHDDVTSCPVVITSYEITMNDRQYIMNNDWKLLIVDEGHRIKNFQCRLITELKMYKSTHRLLLTGTPLQNNLSELWSLLNFLLPEIFDDLGSFEAWFDFNTIQTASHQEIVQEERKKNVLNMLHQILTPFMLRRLKSDIDLNIPPKREVLVYAPLTKKQAEMYKAVADKTIRSLIGCDEEEKERMQIVEVDKKGRPVRKSRGTVNYGKLIGTDEPEVVEKKEKKKGRRSVKPKEEDKKEDKIEDEESAEKKKGKREYDDDDELDSWVEAVTKQQQRREQWGQAKTGLNKEPQGRVINIQLRNAMALLRKTCNHPYLIEYPLTAAGEYKVDEQIVKVSGKFMLLDKMLPELKARGHKVLIFSQMTGILDVIGDYCYLRKWKWCRLDGSMNLNDRREQIDDFNQDPDIFIFLLSTRAGGLGINLTAADTCIIFDSDWNPQCDLQAQDRCHRIGQTKPVLVYRLVTQNTIDQKIVERASAKRKLEKMVIHKGQFKRGLELNAKPVSVITPQELIELLKEIDYDEVVDQSVISDKDLHRLLDRSDLHAKMALNKKCLDQKAIDDLKAEKASKAEDVEGVFKIINEDMGSSGQEKDAVLPCVNAEDTIFGTKQETNSSLPNKKVTLSEESNTNDVDIECDTNKSKDEHSGNNNEDATVDQMEEIQS